MRSRSLRPPSPSPTTLSTVHIRGDTPLLRYLPTYHTELNRSFSTEESDRMSVAVSSGDSLTPGSPLAKIYDRKVASATALLAQLQVTKDRHDGLLDYFQEQQTQLDRNCKLAIAELHSKRDALVAELDSYLLSAVKHVEVKAKEKERLLREKTSEVQVAVRELESKMNVLRLASTVESKGKFVQESSRLMEEAESAGKLWVTDCEFPADWVKVCSPEFDYVLSARNGPSPAPLTEKDLNQDLTPTRLGTANNPIFSGRLSVPRLNLDQQSVTSPFGEWETSGKKSQLQDQLLHQNQRLMSRLECSLHRKLETVIQAKVSRASRPKSLCQDTPVSTQRPSVTLSALISSDFVVYSALRTEEPPGALRLYIPQGYPPYSCFYLLSTRGETTVSEVVSSVRTHMGLSSAREFAIAVQRNALGTQEPLAPGVCLLPAVGRKREAGFPRLFLIAVDF